MISVVIPTLDEEKNLPATLDALMTQAGDFEVVVVDGQSADRTRSIIERFSARDSRIGLLESARGRALQMNAGARATTGDWLVFLHADTLLPDGALSLIENQSDAIQAGCFRHRFSGSSRTLRTLSWFHNRRFRITRVIYGDQGLFIRRELFQRLGGFPDGQMEDIAFGLRIRRVTRPRMLPATLVTDSRKFEQMGPWSATAQAVKLLIRFRFRGEIDRDPFFDAYR